MSVKKETSLHESLDTLIVSIKLHMIINMHFHIQWTVIRHQNQVKLEIGFMEDAKGEIQFLSLGDGVYWCRNRTNINNLKVILFYECLEDRDVIIRVMVIILQTVFIECLLCAINLMLLFLIFTASP